MTTEKIDWSPILQAQRNNSAWYQAQTEWLKAIEKNTARTATAVNFIAALYALALFGALLAWCSSL